eukprot:SAG31_NODE_2198_length_6212_cov_3.843096_7_plen_91_part_00
MDAIWNTGSRNFFAKRFLSSSIDEAAAFDDVKLQMTAKYYAEEFNRWLPPKPIDFLSAFVIKLNEREGEPIFFAEHFMEGTFEKHNSNAG